MSGAGDGAGVPGELWLAASVATVLVIAVRSVAGVLAMRGGGDAVAAMAGGVPVARDTRVPAERRLLNVVDEMAIASIVALADDAVLVLSLLAHAGAAAAGAALAAFSRGTAALRLEGRTPVAADAIAFPEVSAALERLRLLAPFVKGGFLTACVETVVADGAVAVPEAELLRVVATALDCPLPPILEG